LKIGPEGAFVLSSLVVSFQILFSASGRGFAGVEEAGLRSDLGATIR
jgi:hypothetical protein